MSNHLTKAAIAAVAVAVGAACSGAPTDEESTAQTSEAVLGAALPGITATDFATVKANFNAAEQLTDGLGPIFNERACGNCHNNNAAGGAGDNIERRYGRFDNNGQSFNPLGNEGGSLRQLFSVGQFNHGSTVCNAVVESEPADATVHNVGRLTTPTFGLGLVDTLPDSFFQNIVNAEPAATKGVAQHLRHSPRQSRRSQRDRGRDARQSLRHGRARCPSSSSSRPTRTSTRWASPPRAASAAPASPRFAPSPRPTASRSRPAAMTWRRSRPRTSPPRPAARRTPTTPSVPAAPSRAAPRFRTTSRTSPPS